MSCQLSRGLPGFLLVLQWRRAKNKFTGAMSTLPDQVLTQNKADRKQTERCLCKSKYS